MLLELHSSKEVQHFIMFLIHALKANEVVSHRTAELSFRLVMSGGCCGRGIVMAMPLNVMGKWQKLLLPEMITSWDLQM